MLLSYKPLHLEAQQRLQGEGCVVDISSPCTRCLMEALRTDMGENLVSVSCQGRRWRCCLRRSLLEGIALEKFKCTLCYLGGNPRSVDRMTAALWCRFPPGGVILGGAHGLEGLENGDFGGAVLHLTHLAAEIGGMALWRLGVRCAEMDSRRRRTLSGVMVVSMPERHSKVNASGLLRGWIGGRWR